MCLKTEKGKCVFSLRTFKCSLVLLNVLLTHHKEVVKIHLDFVCHLSVTSLQAVFWKISSVSWKQISASWKCDT